MSQKIFSFLFNDGNKQQFKIKEITNKVGNFKYDILNEGDLKNEQIKFLLQKIDLENSKKLGVEEENYFFKIMNSNINIQIDLLKLLNKYKSKILSSPIKVNIHEILKNEYVPQRRTFFNNYNQKNYSNYDKEPFFEISKYENKGKKNKYNYLNDKKRKNNLERTFSDDNLISSFKKRKFNPSNNDYLKDSEFLYSNDFSRYSNYSYYRKSFSTNKIN